MPEEGCRPGWLEEGGNRGWWEEGSLKEGDCTAPFQLQTTTSLITVQFSEFC